MILSEKDIREYAQRQDMPLICPFVEEQLQSASYDVSMSGNIAVLKSTGRLIDPLENEDLSDMYERVSIGINGYLLCPGQYVLAELQERINIPNTLAAHIRPRTRFTRSGVLVASQHCNPTYEGVLQIGIFNAGANSFLLRPGLRIAQIVFEKLSSIPEKLYRDKKDAAYSHEQEFRGSKFGEAAWSEEGKKLFRDVMETLQKEIE